MKKLVLSLIFLASATLAFADIVSLEDARRQAEKFFSSSDARYVWNGTNPKLRQGLQNPAMYVFNGPDEWVIIAGDDCAVPVLMHGKGQIDVNRIPTNMQGLLNSISLNILDARRKGYVAPKEVAALWNPVQTKASENSNAAETVLLKTANWDQWYPYYEHTPVYEDKHCVTGCVATAMAILIRYNQWPKVGTGTIPSYISDNGDQKFTVPAIVNEGYEFDYSKMPLEDYYESGQKWTAEEIEAVSQLMARCGAMVEMEYSTDGSSAYSHVIPDALANYMGYKNTAQDLLRLNFDNAAWFQLLKREIDYNHPLIYGGQDNGGEGGHQFICDGYNSNNEIHINWGWGGYCNAWYAVNYLGGNTGYVFSSYDSAILGLVPNSTPDVVNPLLVQFSSTTLVSGEVKPGKDFSVAFKEIVNWTSGPFKGDVQPALVSMDGTVKEFISTPYSLSLKMNYYTSHTFECKINGPVALGDRIALYYREAGDEWVPVDIHDANCGPMGAFDIPFIDVDSEVPAGYVFYPRIVFGHYTRPGSIDDITFTVNGKALTDNSVTFSKAGTYSIKAALKNSDGSTETLVKVVTVK